MNKRIFFTILLSSILVLGWAGSRAAAQNPAPPASPQGQEAATQSYLLYLPMPDFSQVDIPTGLRREQVVRQAQSWMRTQAAPLLKELREKQAQGEVLSFEFQPDSYAVAVKLPAGENKAQEILERLEGVQETAPESSQATACGSSYAARVEEQFVTLTRVKATPATAAATDPSITVFAPTGSEWTYVYGETLPGVTVSLAIRRGGTTLASETTTSYSDGSYGFYPDWAGGCQGEGYSWALQAGDIVSVTAHGNTISTTVASLSVWLDPDTDIVAGSTGASRSIEIWVYMPLSGQPCTWQKYTLTATSSADGSFQADFTSLVDVKGMASANAYVLDANGNATSTYFNPYSLIIETAYANFNGYLKPDLPFVATLTRASTVVDSYTGKAESTGYYDGYFSTSLLPGDLIDVNGGGLHISYTVAPFSASPDPALNQVTGVTAPGRLVRVYFQKNGVYDNIPTTCGYASDCKATTADGSGNFSVTTLLDLERGDELDYYIYDAAGNYQYQPGAVPAILAMPAWGSVRGYWPTPDTYLTVQLKDASNILLETDYDWTSTWDNNYYTYFSTQILPGYHIVVSDGVNTETMTVQDITGELNSQTDHLTGTAPTGKLLAVLRDYDPTEGYYEYACMTGAHTGGSFDFNFTSQGVEAQDEAMVYLTGIDGHYTAAWSNAFYVYVAYTDGYVEGYIPIPYAPVKIEWLNGDGSPIETQNLTAQDSGYFYRYLNSYPFLAGQRIRVTSGSYAIDLTLPTLTINPDVAQNRYIGISLPSSRNEVVLRHFRLCYKGVGTCYSNIYTTTDADTSGNYVASFNGLYFSDCSPAQVGEACSQGRVRYTRPDEHDMVYWTSYPASVNADTYENDDTFANAVAYTGASSHTFHLSGDVDWIRYVVEGGNVGKRLTLQTYALGSTADTVVELYAPDGITFIASNDDDGDNYTSHLDWTPNTTGTYYIKIRPYNSASTNNCGASYRFLITSRDIFLPLIKR